MAIRDKNTLKTFFETGDMPSQNQFADLIDSFKHQNDTNALILTDREIVSIANRIATIDNGFVEYYFDNMSNSLIKLNVVQENLENQEIEIRCNIHDNGDVRKQYFVGSGPYTVAIKEFESETLQANEYYYLYYETSLYDSIDTLIGHKLPTTFNGLEFGKLDGRSFHFYISKQNFGKELNVLHTNIKFINKTDIPIEYKSQSTNWRDIYRKENSVTAHYDQWDYLYFSYNADMTKEDYTIECSVYDTDTNELLIIDYLEPGINYRHFGNSSDSEGNRADKVRNITIECIRV
jgi:hypothetical protein